MQLGLTWPLQRLLRTSVPYGAPVSKLFCWDAHCISLHGQSSLLLVHCPSRYACVRFGLSPYDWNRLEEIVWEEIRYGLLEGGISEKVVESYLSHAHTLECTRTHGRREVAFLNRAWEDVLTADLLVDQGNQRQPLLNHAVNSRLCRCAGREETATALEHLQFAFSLFENQIQS